MTTLTPDHLHGFALALCFAGLMAASALQAESARDYSFSYDYDVPGARTCYYTRGQREFRLTVRSSVDCPVMVRLK